MKLQNMTVIFIIIMIPIIIVTSYYIGLQIKTITMQKDYTVKLQTAAKDSIQALEINTVEWNSSSSNLADSKRRDVLAAINTFTTSLANSMGIGGAGKGRIQTYIPAIAYTMYDGYYIYSASNVKTQETDENGLTQFNDDGAIITNGESYQYILKPYSPYSARYVNGSIDITVNYTLDNYIKIYGTVGSDYVTKEGYLVVCDDDVGIKNVIDKSISGITYRTASIGPETLKEQIYANGEVKEYKYIYDQYDNKQYWDSSENNYFTVNANNQKVYLQPAVAIEDANFSISNTFRKISVPLISVSDYSVLKIFQILNPGGDYKFYYEDTTGAYIELPDTMSITGKPTGNDLQDYSAINYCVESYVFTKWVTSNLSGITVNDLKSPEGGQYNNVEGTAPIFDISKSNNPDPENKDAYAESALAQHKKDIIINTLEKNLAQAQAQAQVMNPNYEYRLPQLTYDEWEQALSNISIIAYMQGMPIGLKYYNNYTIATSTLNKEYVDPDELYFAGINDKYYHQRNCKQATGSNYVGYRSIDYVAKSYEVSDETKYYYPHDNKAITNTDAELECYYCLVNRSTYNKNKETTDASKVKKWTNTYYNALARERYKSIEDPSTYKPNISIEKTCDLPSELVYDSELIYTITITNNGAVDDTINLKDYWNKDSMSWVSFEGSTASSGSSTITALSTSIGEVNEQFEINSQSIKSGERITIKYKTKIKANVGETINNTASVYSSVSDTTIYDTANVTVSGIEKIVSFSVQKKESSNYNIIFLLDHSNSMSKNSTEAMYRAISNLTTNTGALYQLYEQVNNNGGTVHFSIIYFARTIITDSDVSNVTNINALQSVSDKYSGLSGLDVTWAGTSYESALKTAYNGRLTGTNDKNIVVLLTDGNPTPTDLGSATTEYRIMSDGIGESYQWRTWPALTAEWAWFDCIWLRERAAIKLWDGIKSVVAEMNETGNTEIYCINYGANGAEYGLQTIISSGEGYYREANEDNISNIFTEIVNDIKTLEIDATPQYSSGGIIKLNNVESIKCIKVNGIEKQNNDLEKPIDEKGELDLSQFEASDTIEIVYE